MCTYYDTSAHNQCREPTAEFVSDKERANFCEMFRGVDGERGAKADVEAAKAKLEGFFRK